MRGTELNRWWRIGIPIVTPLLRLLFRVVVEGIACIPQRGPAILVFNHVSVLDGPVLAIEVARRAGRETRFLIAAEVFRKPFFGTLLRGCEQIPIRRGEGDVEALGEAIETVRGGAMAGIAPEGRVHHDPGEGLQRVRRGVARIALPTGAPVVPVGIWGTNERWPLGGIRWRRPIRPQVVLAFGDLLLPDGDPASVHDIDAFVERIRGALDLQVERARAIAVAR